MKAKICRKIRTSSVVIILTLSIERAYSQSKKSSLDQLSCFLLGFLYCTA